MTAHRKSSALTTTPPSHMWDSEATLSCSDNCPIASLSHPIVFFSITHCYSFTFGQINNDDDDDVVRVYSLLNSPNFTPLFMHLISKFEHTFV